MKRYIPAALSGGTRCTVFSSHCHQKSFPGLCLEVQPKLFQACQVQLDLQT